MGRCRMRAMRMETISVPISSEMKSELQAAADARDVTMAWIVRQAVGEWLLKESRRRRRVRGEAG